MRQLVEPEFNRAHDLQETTVRLSRDQPGITPRNSVKHLLFKNKSDITMVHRLLCNCTELKWLLEILTWFYLSPIAPCVTQPSDRRDLPSPNFRNSVKLAYLYRLRKISS